MSFEVTGKIEVIYETQKVTATFEKREFVLVVVEGAYSEYIKFQLTKEKCSLLDDFRVGDEVKISFNLKGKPYTKDGKTTYFTNLDVWRIDNNEVAAPKTTSEKSKTDKKKTVKTNFDDIVDTKSNVSDWNSATNFSEKDDEDGLPF